MEARSIYQHSPEATIFSSKIDINPAPSTSTVDRKCWKKTKYNSPTIEIPGPVETIFVKKGRYGGGRCFSPSNIGEQPFCLCAA